MKSPKKSNLRYAWIPTGVDNIYRRVEKFYLVKMTEGERQYTLLADPDGRPVTTLADAIAAAARLVANPFVGNATPIAETMKAFFADKLKQGEWEETTKAGHRHVYDAFARAVPKAITAISTADLQAWYNAERLRVSDNSALTYFACIASLFRWAHAKRLLTHNPALDVEVVKPEPAADGRFCTYEQRDQLIRTATNPELKLYLILGFHFGLRRRELDHARPEWIDLIFRVVNVLNLLKPKAPLRYFRIKNGKERRIPMSKEATKVLRKTIKDFPAGALYLVHPQKLEQGKNRYRYDMRRPFEDHVKAQGMPWVTIQTMRITFASLLASTGKATIQMIADWLGDTIKTTEDRYAHLIPRHDIIEAAFEGARPKKRKR